VKKSGFSIVIAADSTQKVIAKRISTFKIKIVLLIIITWFILSIFFAFSYFIGFGQNQSRIQSNGSAISTVYDTLLSQSPEIATASSTLFRIDEDLKALKNLLFDDPEAIITIPLIKKDIELLSKENQTLRNEVDSIGSQSKWIIGITITLVVGMLGIIITLLIGNKENVAPELYEKLLEHYSKSGDSA